MSDTPDTPDATTSTEPAELAAAGSRSRRRALWAALAVVAVAAGTLAVVANDDDGSSPRLPLALGSDGATAGGRSAEAADMAMMAYVHYTAGDDLPRLGGSGPAYRLTGELDLDAFQVVAAALGLSGKPEVRDGVAHLESDGKALEASEYGGGAWWYSPYYDDGGGSTGSSGSGSSGMTPEERKEADARAAETSASPKEAVAEAPADDGGRTEPGDPSLIEPIERRPAADLPTEDEARTIALDLLAAAGMDVDGAKVLVDGPYEAWYVSVEPEIDGLPVSGLMASVSVGPRGEVQSASGWLNDPERLGDYPTIDTRQAIERLNDGSAYGGREGVTPLAVEEDAGDGETVGGDAVDPDAPVSSDQDPIQIDPMPTEPAGPPEPLEVVLHQAERVLVMVGANDGSTDTYLVPGYHLRDHGGDDAHVVYVPAVDDDSLLPAVDQPVPEPMPVDPGDPGDGTPGCAQPEPGPDGAVPDICLDPKSVPPAEPRTAPGVGEG